MRGRPRGLSAGRGAVLLCMLACVAVALALLAPAGEPVPDGAATAPAGESRAAASAQRPEGREPPERPGPAAPSESPQRTTPEIRTLSNERSRSRWAFVEAATAARSGPSKEAQALTRLRKRTGDRTPELVLALAEATDRDGGPWVRVRLPLRPNNSTGWVERGRLGRYYAVTTFLRIDRDRLRATLYDEGRPVWRAPVAVGTAEAPTPSGRFYVRSRIVPREAGGPYGVFAFGTNAFSPGESDWPGGGVVGIHGTDEPGLIPGRVSHGCIRVRNADARRLRRLMPLGTPIRVV